MDVNPDSTPEAPTHHECLFQVKMCSLQLINTTVKGIHSCRTTLDGGFLRLLSPPNADRRFHLAVPIAVLGKVIFPMCMS